MGLCVFVCGEGTVMYTHLDSRHMAGLKTLQLHINLQVMYATLCVYPCVCQCIHACVLVGCLCVTIHLSLSVYITVLASPPSLMPAIDMTVYDISD